PALGWRRRSRPALRTGPARQPARRGHPEQPQQGRPGAARQPAGGLQAEGPRALPRGGEALLPGADPMKRALLCWVVLSWSAPAWALSSAVTEGLQLLEDWQLEDALQLAQQQLREHPD